MSLTGSKKSEWNNSMASLDNLSRFKFTTKSFTQFIFTTKIFTFQGTGLWPIGYYYEFSPDIEK